MRHYYKTLALRDIQKFKRIHGIYRVIDAQHYDLIEGFFYQLTLCDGKSRVQMCTALNRVENQNFAIGGFAFVEAIKSNSVWRVISTSIISSRLALENQGYAFDEKRLELACKQSTREIFESVKSKKILKLLQLFESSLALKIKQGITIDFWIESSVWHFLHNIVSIKFETQLEHDYAMVFGGLYALFYEYVGPSKKFDMTVNQDMNYLDLVNEISLFLTREFPEFSDMFINIICETEPLNVVGSKLVQTSFIKAIQIVSFHSVYCFGREVKDELVAA
tara:strand:- start:1175 stop:2008 length:834 start_codon:yes stop_codon:yes gene_type:complete